MTRHPNPAPEPEGSNLFLGQTPVFWAGFLALVTTILAHHYHWQAAL